MTAIGIALFVAALIVAGVLLRNILRAWRASREINARRAEWEAASR